MTWFQRPFGASRATVRAHWWPTGIAVWPKPNCWFGGPRDGRHPGACAEIFSDLDVFFFNYFINHMLKNDWEVILSQIKFQEIYVLQYWLYEIYYCTVFNVLFPIWMSWSGWYWGGLREASHAATGHVLGLGDPAASTRGQIVRLDEKMERCCIHKLLQFMYATVYIETW